MGRLTYQIPCENVVDVIRMKVLNHELIPGVRAIEQDISDGLGVNHGPIREALRRLEQGGLVEYVRNVGCSVGNITLEDIYEIYLLRATYEISVVKLCRKVSLKTTSVEVDVVLESTRGLKDMDCNKSIACDNTPHEVII